MKKQKKPQKSINKRVPNRLLKKIEKRGEGKFRVGLYQMDTVCDMIERDPSILLVKELEHFGNLIHAFLPDNHHSHYVDSGLPVVLRRFIATGEVDIDFLKKVRNEKKLDEFEEVNDGSKSN